MVFKRRERRPFGRRFTEFFYPRGGWARALSYMRHRLSRLPDQPHRIARGIAAGVFASFTPLFGFHFMAAAGLAVIIRGNVIAALLATFVGNPLTFPLIMALSVELGNRMLGLPSDMQLPQIITAFGSASREFWHNMAAWYSGDPVHWDRMVRFFQRVFVPYFIGGLIPGIVAGTTAHYLALPLIRAYQKRREKRMQDPPRPARAGRQGQENRDMTQSDRLRLGVNIDHVATLRNARGGAIPDPLRAAKLAEAAGADGITAHLREDRRHIRDADIDALAAGCVFR